MTSFDPDLDTLLSDPLIRSVMKADRVNPERLRDKLTRIGAEIARRKGTRRKHDTARDCVDAGFAARRNPRPAAPAGGIW